MNNVEQQQQFVCLRAGGWSFARIAEELAISKPTLINWSRKYQFGVQQWEPIIRKYYGPKPASPLKSERLHADTP